MPRIYELPASSTPENRSLVIEHTAATIPGGAKPGWGLPAQQAQHENVFKISASMLRNLRDKEFNDITRWFDSQVAILDQQQLDPDKYKTTYARLQSQAATQRTTIQAKHVANANQIRMMQGLVEDDMLDPAQMEQAILVMAGVPKEQVRAAYTRQTQQKPMARLRGLKYTAERIQNWRAQFDFDKRGNLNLVDEDGKKLRGTSEDEQKKYAEEEYRLKAIEEEMQGLYEEVSPLEKLSMAGSQAVERFGMKRKPQRGYSVYGLNKFGAIQHRFVPESAPTSGKQPTEKEFRDTIAKLKTAGSTKKAKAYYDKWVDKIWPE